MRIRQLESFVTVCELGSITRAAAALNIVQPALGAQLSALESELGVTLLKRSRRGTSLTPAGSYLLDEARKILDSVSTVRRTIRSFAPGDGSYISVGLTASLSAMLAGPLAQDLAHLSDAVSVHMVTDMSHNLGERVARGDLDLALAFNVPAHKAIRRRPMLEESIFFVTRPGGELGREGPIGLFELTTATIVIPSDKGQIIQLLKDAVGERGLRLNVAFQIESMDAIKGLIAEGTACGVLPFGSVMREVRDGTLLARRIADPPIRRTLFLLERATGAPSEAVRAAADTIERSVARLAGNLAFEAVA